mgnify:CR=1 FL=1
MENYFSTKINNETLKDGNLKNLIQQMLNLNVDPLNNIIHETIEGKKFVVQQKTIENYMKFLKPIQKNNCKKIHPKKEKNKKIILGESNLIFITNGINIIPDELK